MFSYLEVYTAFLIIYSIIKIVRKKKVPVIILTWNFILIGLFFYLRYLVDNHKLIFIKGYNDSPEDWGEGLANVMISIYNLGIIFLAFCFIQILFWRLFLHKYKK